MKAIPIMARLPRLQLNCRAGHRVAFGRVAICGAQVGPIDVGAQIFATHSATRLPFDFGAMLRRHWADTGTPLTQKRRRNPYFFGQFLGRSRGIREVLLEVHSHSINESLIRVNSVS